MSNCSCSGSNRLVLACSGASNVGQLTNEVAKRLDAEKSAKFYCLAGPGGHVPAMTANVQAADKVLVLDGCPVACAKLIAEQAGITDYDYVMVTDLGIEKSRDFNLPEADIETVLSAGRAALNGTGD